MKNINLKIITPEGIKFNDDVEFLETTTPSGKIVICINHVNVIAKIEDCESFIKIKDDKKACVILSGLMYTTKTEIKIFAEYFNFVSDIDVKSMQEKILQGDNKLKTLKQDSKEFLILKNNLIRGKHLLEILKK